LASGFAPNTVAKETSVLRPSRTATASSREEALALGHAIFYIGEPCKNGHFSDRKIMGTRNRCVECMRQHCRAFHLANKMTENARSRAYRDAHIEQQRAKAAEWAAANPEQKRAHKRAAYARDPAKNREAAARYKRAHLPAVLARNAARRAAKAGAVGSYAPSDIARLMRAQDGRCVYCARRFGPRLKSTIDHVLPLALGGSNDPTNLQLACGRCNSSKGAKHPHAFANQLGRLL
jgi:5-methylcytosine-specific restriction endonuclease McrA